VEQSSTPPEAKAFSAPVVLIVEDEFSVRWVAAEYLREAAYSVIEASNAADAITVLTSGARIDLAFIDFKLPGGLNGLMLAKWLDTYRPAIPVLLTSGLAETLPRFYRDNSRRYIPKPYSFPDVAMQIRDMLQSRGP
jgi:CheY-like chemotaxis protein